MSLLQKYLLLGGTLDELEQKYAINATRHKKYPNIVLLKYNQIESPFSEPIVRESRGIILDEADNWSIRCARFSKFFNYMEGHAAPVDWMTAKCLEKVDGSLITIYFYDGSWVAATSGSPDASGLVNGFDFTFAELFWKTFNEMGLKVPDNTDLCPSFELTSIFNKVVVQHKESRLTFIGLHNRATGEELLLTELPQYKNIMVKEYPLVTLNDMIEALKLSSPIETEGFVVRCDTRDQFGNFNRIKIKSEQYVSLHHIRDSFCPRRMVEIVRAGEIDEIVVYFSEFADMLNEIKGRYDKLAQDLTDAYDVIKEIPVQKDFALAVQANKEIVLPAAMFMLRAGKIKSIRDYISTMNIKYLMDVLALKD